MLSGGQGSILGSVGCISKSWWLPFLNQGLKGCRKRGMTGDEDEHTTNTPCTRPPEHITHLAGVPQTMDASWRVVSATVA